MGGQAKKNNHGWTRIKTKQRHEFHGLARIGTNGLEFVSIREIRVWGLNQYSSAVVFLQQTFERAKNNLEKIICAVRESVQGSNPWEK